MEVLSSRLRQLLSHGTGAILLLQLLLQLFNFFLLERFCKPNTAAYTEQTAHLQDHLGVEQRAAHAGRLNEVFLQRGVLLLSFRQLLLQLADSVSGTCK